MMKCIITYFNLAFKALKEKHSDAKLLIAPRHPERYCDVESLIKESGYTWGKRSTKDNFDNADVIMLDTITREVREIA